MLLINDFKSAKLTYGLVITLMLSGCGGSGSGGSDAEKLSGVSDVSGNYSMITSAISVECTDGSTDTLPAQALSGAIVHNGNKVEFFNDAQGPGSGSGITIIERDATDGIINEDGKFVITTSILASIDGIDGNLTINYHLSGYFNDSGWSGDYVYSFFSHNLSETCTFSSPFSGSKS